MRTIKQAATRAVLYDYLDEAMALYAEKIKIDISEGKTNKSAADALESLVRTWATLHTTMDACDIAEKVMSIAGKEIATDTDTDKSPEIPIQFPNPRRIGG